MGTDIADSISNPLNTIFHHWQWLSVTKSPLNPEIAKKSALNCLVDDYETIWLSEDIFSYP